MRCYKKDSIQLGVQQGEEENIKDVATALYEQIKESDLKLTIDCAGLLRAILKECGVESLQ